MSAGAGGMNISTYLGSFLALLRNASAFDRIEDWNGAADLDEKLHRNKQKRLAQEEAAKIRPAPIRQPDAPVSRKPRLFMALAEGLVDCAKLGEVVSVNVSSAAAEILAQVGDRRGAGDQKNVGRAMQQPGERHLHRRRAEPCCDLESVEDWSGVKPPSGKNGHIGDAAARQFVDQRVVVAMHEVVVVLHADDLGDAAAPV